DHELHEFEIINRYNYLNPDDKTYRGNNIFTQIRKYWSEEDKRIMNLYLNNWCTQIGQIVNQLYYDAINECLKLHNTVSNGLAIDPDAIKNLVGYDPNYVQQLLDQKAMQEQMALQQQQLQLQQQYQEEMEAQAGVDGNLFRTEPTPINVAQLVQSTAEPANVNVTAQQPADDLSAEETAATDEQGIHTTQPPMTMREAFDKYKALDETNKRLVDLFIQRLWKAG
ncbi:MAG: hypothetical protein NC489_40120, partial [Ruminococcus flavefaciens]|nr:hypothetical protein [Ruminococcus flavefaciens]